MTTTFCLYDKQKKGAVVTENLAVHVYVSLIKQQNGFAADHDILFEIFLISFDNSDTKHCTAPSTTFKVAPSSSRTFAIIT